MAANGNAEPIETIPGEVKFCCIEMAINVTAIVCVGVGVDVVSVVIDDGDTAIEETDVVTASDDKFESLFLEFNKTMLDIIAAAAKIPTKRNNTRKRFCFFLGLSGGVD